MLTISPEIEVCHRLAEKKQFKKQERFAAWKLELLRPKTFTNVQMTEEFFDFG